MLRQVNRRIKKDRFTGVYAIYRLLTAYLVMLIFQMRCNPGPFTATLFFTSASLPVLISGMIAVWVILCLFCKDRWCFPAVICLLTVYSYLAVKQNHEELFLLGCIGVIAVFIALLKCEHETLKLSGRLLWICVIGFGLLLTVLVGSTCVMMYRDNRTSCFDFGLFSQMFHYMRTTGLPMTTCERDGLLNHFAVHISPVFYLLLPVFMLVPKQETLLVMQCVVTFSGVIPLVLLCRRRDLSDLSVIGFAVCYMLYPSFTGGCYYCFHENNFLPPLLMWLIWFFEMDQRSGSVKHGIAGDALLFTTAILTMGIKEDAAVYTACVALFFFVMNLRQCSKQHTRMEVLSSRAMWVFLLSVAYFAAAVLFLSVKGDGAMTGRYTTYIYDDSGSLLVMLMGILKNPVFVVAQCMSETKLTLAAYMLLPLSLLPILSKKPENWILMFPFLLINVMPNYSYQNSIMYQYGFGSGAMLIYLALINYTETGKKEKLLVMAVSASILIYGFHFGGKWQYYRELSQGNAEYRREIEQALELIPEDASLAAATFLVPVMSQRDELYELETTRTVCEYYAIDERGAAPDPKYLDDDIYEEIFRKEGVISVYRMKNWKAGMLSSGERFRNTADYLLKGTENAVRAFLVTHTPDGLGDLTIGSQTVTRVESDQHWITVSQTGDPEAVYIVDSLGVLIYFSYRDAEYVVTWSGPTEDQEFAASQGGWSNGKGAGWTGSISMK